MHHLTRYLELQQGVIQIEPPPRSGLELVIVIPCLAEPGIIELLEHLQQTCRIRAEIIIVVNHADNAPAHVRACNKRTLADIRQWSEGAHAVPVHAIAAFDLPARHAGVGLARKIGMDTAAYRLAAVGRFDGVIASLDADCRVSAQYLQGLADAFAEKPAMQAATLAYAHRLEECVDARHRYAMACYELFLRYVSLGWLRAGLPYAFTSIGSCFALRANVYARHHGMNRRKAGEDFYFLHKLAREKPLEHIDTVQVFPSARLNSRTPFGTGQAMADWYHGGENSWRVASPVRFDDLADLNDSLDRLFTMPDAEWLQQLPDTLANYLEQAGMPKAVANMRRHAAQPASFRKRFYVWFDGLKAWRYVQQSGQQCTIEQAVAALLQHFDISTEETDAEVLLEQMRSLS